MLLNKLKAATATFALAAIIITGIGVTAWPTPKAAAEPPKAAPAKPTERPATDRDRLQGTWVMIAGAADGAKIPPEYVKEGRKWLFAGDRLLILRGDQPGRHEESSYRIESNREPKTLDRVPADGPDKGRIVPAVYMFLNEFLIVCDNATTKVRPDRFRSGAEGHNRVLVFRREDPAAGPALTDEEFLRRACQVLRGVAVTHLEKTYFLADKDAGKRAKVLAWLTGGTRVETPRQGYFRIGATDLNSTTFDTWQLGLNDTLWFSGAQQPYSRVLVGTTNLNTINPSYHELEYFVPANPQRLLVNEIYQPYINIDYSSSIAGDDMQYLRRVMLDMSGMLPTTLEARYFESDKDPNKREKVVQWLAQAPEYKQHALARFMWQSTLRQSIAPTLSQDLNRYSNAAQAGGPDRLDQLLTQLLAEKKSDEQTLEALYLATLARYPTDDAKRVILAQVGKQADRAAAWKDVLHTLTQSKDARDYADALKRRAGQPK
jgi:uncharacterized protein (TIGR03067 family)